MNLSPYILLVSIKVSNNKINFAMKSLLKNSVIVMLLLGTAIYFTSCKKEKEATPPVVITTNVSDITQTSASTGGVVEDNGGAEITDIGVCWSTSQNPTTSSNKISIGKISIGKNAGSFTGSLTELTANTRYFVRAYAINSVGTAYGLEISFSTEELPPNPEVTTSAVISFSSTSAVVKGNVIYGQIGVHLIGSGVCWSTSPNPTTDGSKTMNVTYSGIFTSNLTGLTQGTTYYVRAYALYDNGPAIYGKDITFTTLFSDTITDVDGNLYNTVKIGTQLWMSENFKATKYNDGTSIPNVTENAGWPIVPTSDAYCWYNNDVANKTPYGALYNVVAVNTGKLCPVDWHVATNDDWHKMILFLDPNATQGVDESYIAGSMIKETGTLHWDAPNIGATNESGFTALPGGIRFTDPFGFAQLGNNANYWSAGSDYQVRLLIDGNNTIEQKPGSFLNRGNGNSVRCIKN